METTAKLNENLEEMFFEILRLVLLKINYRHPAARYRRAD
jgi:hypothetical protein